MPTREAIVDSVIPREVEKPIPVRTITTRSPRPTPAAPIGDQPPTSGSTPVAESTPAAESVRLSPQLSALARKEQAFRQREQALKDREKTIADKLASAEKFEQLKAKLSAKDYSEAEALGLDYEGYTQYLLGKQNGEKPENQALKKLEDEVSALKKGQEENTTKQFDATVAEYRKEIATFVASTPGYEGLRDPDNQGAILQLILDDFEIDGVETSIEQAAKEAKAFLTEKAQRLSVFLEKAEPPVVEEKKPLPPPVKTTGLKTLTQQVTTGADSAPLKSLQHMSESERYAEARRRALAKRALAEQGKR